MDQSARSCAVRLRLPSPVLLSVGVPTAYPGGTDTPMMKSNRAGPELGRTFPGSEAGDGGRGERSLGALSKADRWREFIDARTKT
jgi:hypothetical protein